MVYIFDGMKVPGVKVPAPNERTINILLAPELGNTDNFTALFSKLSPENIIDSHTHESDEFMYVISGKGEAICGDEKKEISADSIIWAPKKIRHLIKNSGDETLKLLCIFIPPLKPSGVFIEAIEKARTINLRN